MERQLREKKEMKQPILAIVGSAPNALDDLRDLTLIADLERDCVMAIGLDAIDRIRGRCRYVVTNHFEDVEAIQDKMARHENHDWFLVAPAPLDPSRNPWAGIEIDIVEPYYPPVGRSGSSAMTGTLAALRMGYDRIVLCGCPLTGNAPEGNPYEAFRLGWEDRKDELIGRVKSMSGWTRELLGAPTKEWIDG